MSKKVAENLNMARPILSRFDVVFILRDRADKDQDRLVSSNITNLYRRQGVEGGGSSIILDVTEETMVKLAEKYLTNDKENTQQMQDPFQDGFAPRPENRVPIEKRLAWVAGFNEALPAGLVRDLLRMPESCANRN
jgi:hypothetical protein